MICLFLSLGKRQVTELEVLQNFRIQVIDNIQQRLVDLSCIYQTKIKKNVGQLFEDYPKTIINFITNLNQNLMKRSMDEENLESQILMPLMEQVDLELQ